MNPLSIVIITVIASLLILVLIASIAALVYAHVLVRRQISSLVLTIDSSKTKIDSSLNRMETLIVSIRGDKIEAAAKTLLEAVPRLASQITRSQETVVAFREALQYLQGEAEISNSALDRARQSGLGPESYAPSAPGEHFVTSTRTAAGDAIAIAEESELNTATAIATTTDSGLPDGQRSSLPVLRTFGTD